MFQKTNTSDRIYLQLAENNGFEEEEEHKPMFEKVSLFTKFRYWMNEKLQFNHQFRVLKLDKTTYPPIYTSNEINNQNYTWYNFLPKFFYNQFKYFYNVYYLALCVSQMIPQLQIGLLFCYVGPLAFVLTVSFVNEVIDDYKRYSRDKEMNYELFQVLNENGELLQTKAGNIKVGNVIKIEAGQRVPADVVILYTSDKNERVYVKTDQLDGETDLKLRRPIDVTQIRMSTSMRQLFDRKVEFIVDKPNESIYKFEGALQAQNSDGSVVEQRFPISVEHTIWASCVVSSAECYGLVIYTGIDTKIKVNNNEIKAKKTQVDKEINSQSKLLFFSMLMISVFLQYCRGFSHNWFIQFFRYLLLLSSIIPLSLKVNQDFSKLYFSYRISHDLEIKDTQAKNTSIPEDLGRIEYIQSDKTGTLTKNEMKMKRLAMKNVTITTERPAELLKRISDCYQKENIIKTSQAELNSSNSKRIPKGPIKYDLLRNILNTIAICNTVVVVNQEGEERKLESSSPDEIAMVEFLEEYGFKLLQRSDTSGTYKLPNKELLTFKILMTFPFSSERKRMGIIIEIDDQIVFYLKGADSIMKDRISDKYEAIIMEETDNLSREGLRTLVLGKKLIEVEQWKSWKEKYTKETAAMVDRDLRVAAVIAELERDMDFVGITAVEDKLQAGVYSSVELLRNAGIKVWMLTGDKMETAKCICISTGLRKSNERILVIEETTDMYELEKTMSLYQNSISWRDRSMLIIDGSSLATALRPNQVELFLKLATKVSTVCCARCAPSQKSEIATRQVEFVKKNKTRCQAIGDGGNDVGMIRIADVGIGIVGKEGQQAALAADYSILEFKHVVKLILWHGRLNYKRISVMAHFVIHRGLIISIMQAIFTLVFYMVDLPLFNGLLMFGYSTVYTMLPVLALICDVDLEYETCLQYPLIYKNSLKGRKLSTKMFLIWFLKSVYQGVSIMFCSLWLFDNSSKDIVTISFTSLIAIELLNTITSVNFNFLYIK